MRQPSAHSFAGIALALAAQVGATSNVGAQVLTYGGKSDLAFSVSSYTYSSSAFTNSIAFDNFAIGSGSLWTITAVFGTIDNNGYTPLVTALNWEIRQGMVAGGSTGTVVHAGSGTFSQSANVYTIATTPFTLNAGTYWLGIWADLSGTTLRTPTASVTSAST